MLFASALVLLAAAPAFAADVLIYGPSEAIEEDVATADGHTVTVADEAAWGAMTTEQFAAFDAIVIGDGSCGKGGSIGGAETNRTTWSPVVTGPIVASAFDPGAHTDGEGGNQEEELVSNAINHVAGGPGTGLYVAVACYYSGEAINPITVLDQFGTFTGDGNSADFISIVDGTHPVMTGLTDAGLSEWGSSTHTHFLTFPASFATLATAAQDLGPLGTGGPVELPVLIAQGAQPTPTPTPTATPVVTGTPAPSTSPAASQLPNTMAGSPDGDAAAMIMGMLVLASVSLVSMAVLRRRGVIGSR